MALETVKVIVRCRPLNNREKSLNCKDVVSIDSNRGQCSICNPNRPKDPSKIFCFDGAFGSTSTTEQIYADIVYPLVEGVTEGYNGTIFAYGQTGCGKTFTMQGVPNDVANKGIIARSFEHVFETIAASSDVKYLVHASFLEIYNEELRDLLGKDSRIKCEIKEHPEKGVYVTGLSMHKVKCVGDCTAVMDEGWKNRHVGATLMNADSSRSHSIFTICLEMVSTNEATGSEQLRAGKLNLVDLAGSERQSKTGATGDRLKEATKINLSLSALGNVISALVDANSKHVPYRDSKLTRLLQDSLGGNTKTLMIACLSPADNNYDETLSTLRYANRAKNIKNKPVINEDPKDALLRQYQEEIARLKAMLVGKAPSEQVCRASALESEEFLKERQRIEEDYEKRLRDKEILYEKEAANTAKLQEEMAKLKEHYDSKLRRLEDKYKSRLIPFDASEAEGLPPLRLDKMEARAKLQSEEDGEGLRSVSRSFVQRGHRLTGQTSSEGDEAPPQIMDGESGSVESLRSIGRPQFAVHLSTTTLLGITTPSDGISREYDVLTKEELLRRLHLLEADMVGGEEAGNVEVCERRSRRRHHAEERRRLLAEANAALDSADDADDDGIMLGIYDSIQDELRHKCKLLQREKQKCIGLEIEIDDLQREFELDREDYLETIRKQNRQIDLLQSILDKVQPCIRRDSNYFNLDKIKKLASYDEDNNEWVLPAFTVERTVLPISVGTNPGSSEISGDDFFAVSRGNTGRVGGASNRLAGTLRDSEAEKEEEARLYAKIASRSQNHTKYFANKRKEQLLMDAACAGTNRMGFHGAESRSQMNKDSFLNNSNSHYTQSNPKRPGNGKLNDSLSSNNKNLDH